MLVPIKRRYSAVRWAHAESDKYFTTHNFVSQLENGHNKVAGKVIKLPCMKKIKTYSKYNCIKMCVEFSVNTYFR